jgi:hypothetical protein
VVAATVDSKDNTYVAKDVQEFIKDGLTIERIPIEDVRNRFDICKCNHTVDMFEGKEG